MAKRDQLQANLNGMGIPAVLRQSFPACTPDEITKATGAIIRALGTCHGGESEDVCQDLLIRLASDLPAKYDGRCLATWLGMVTRNMVKDHYRQAYLARRDDMSIDASSTIDQSSASQPDCLLESKQAANAAQMVLQSLDAREQQILAVIHSGGDVGQLAEELGVTVGHVRNIYTRINATVANAIRKAAPEETESFTGNIGGLIPSDDDWRNE
jgi:RNA polymerase sigma factor (sigma-70 family)